MNNKTKEIIEIFGKIYENPKTQLTHESDFELLVGVILSAQCTDARVNIVTEELFKEYNTPEKMLKLSNNQLENFIKPCGLYKNKAGFILSCSKDIIEKFNGRVPDNLKDLMSLKGIGRKSANVLYSFAFGGDAIAVDTHVFRVSRRLGLSSGKNPLQTEKELQKAIDKKYWSVAHHYLIYHGRRVCKARKPDCENCKVSHLCDYYKTLPLS